jgi:hypothetical protein
MAVRGRKGMTLVTKALAVTVADARSWSVE